MESMYSVGLALWQSNDVAVTAGYEKWLMIFAGVVALSLFINMVVTAVAGMAAMKAIKDVTVLVKDLHAKSAPIIANTSEIIGDLKPKIQKVSENVTQMSFTVREKVDQVGETVSQVNRTVQETNQRTRGQVDHVDRMVSSALHATEDVTHSVVHGIKVPLRQIAGIVTGLRVGVETLIENFSKRGGPGGPAL